MCSKTVYVNDLEDEKMHNVMAFFTYVPQARAVVLAVVTEAHHTDTLFLSLIRYISRRGCSKQNLNLRPQILTRNHLLYGRQIAYTS